LNKRLNHFRLALRQILTCFDFTLYEGSPNSSVRAPHKLVYNSSRAEHKLLVQTKECQNVKINKSTFIRKNGEFLVWL